MNNAQAMAETGTIDSGTFRHVLGHYPTGVSVVTSANEDGSPAAGMVVGTFNSVSVDPPLVAFLPDKSSSSWPLIEKTGRFCVNVLGADQEALCRKFSARGGDKFEGVEWRRSPSGLPILNGVVAWVDCSIEQVVESGDHYIVVGRVLSLDVESSELPLTFHRGKFHQPSPVSDEDAKSADDAEMRQIAAKLFNVEREPAFAEDIAELANKYVQGYSHLAESRSELIVTMLRDYLTDLVASYKNIAIGRVDPRESMKAFIRTTLDNHRDHRAAAILYQNERHALIDVDTTELVALEREMQRCWIEMIERGKSESVFTTEIDSALAYFLVRDALFLTVRWFRSDGRLSLEEVAAQADQLILHGMMADAVAS